MTIHVNAEQAKVDAKKQLDAWMLKCVKKGGKGHDTSHGQTNSFGVGYPGASESDPATILESEWATVSTWWQKELLFDVQYSRWVIGSFGGAAGVWDLCCSCSACEAVKKRDFKSTSGYSSKPRTFVYHLKLAKVAPVSPPPVVSVPKVVSPVAPLSVVFTIQASSSYSDDSLMLDYKIDTGGGSMAGKLDKDGKARITLPFGVLLPGCKIGLQGSTVAGATVKPREDYMLPGGRYMFRIVLA